MKGVATWLGQLALVVLGLVVAGLSWSLPAVAKPRAASATTVTVTAGKPSEFRYKLSKSKVPKGTVTFKVKNIGHRPSRLQDRRQEDEAAEDGQVRHADRHLREGRQVRLHLHGGRPCGGGHEGYPHRHVVVRPWRPFAGRRHLGCAGPQSLPCPLRNVPLKSCGLRAEYHPVRTALRERLIPVLVVGFAAAAAPGLLISLVGQHAINLDGNVHFYAVGLTALADRGRARSR